MPRQDVPYGGAICRLKERIAEIWDELGKKLHSINGVEGDAAGDVKIVSGDAAVVVTSDQLQHEIEITLDTSQLPAADVNSVNGQTGTVALTADDIPSDNGDVHIYLDFFEKQRDGRYLRSSDDFIEILFDDGFIKSELAKNGFELIGKFEDFSLEQVKPTSQRVLWVCKKKKQ